jgi:hypothetical protein
MRFSALSGAAASVALATLVAAEGATDVLALTTAEFEKSIAEEPLMLVEFYAPWYVLKNMNKESRAYVYPGVVTARLLPLTTTRLPWYSRRRASSSPRLTVWRRPNFARHRVCRATRQYTCCI